MYKIKQSMFSVFGRDRLDPIDDRTKGQPLNDWKNSSKTLWCRSNLLSPLDKGGMTYMESICRDIWPEEEDRNESNTVRLL